MWYLRSKRPKHRGFTLIEASLATVIIGVGVVAMLELIAAGTRVNVDGTERTTATNLAKNVREYALKLNFAQVAALGGAQWTPAIDSRGTQMSDFDGWAQTVSVSAVNPKNLNSTVASTGAVALRVTVVVTHHGDPNCTLSWYAFKAN
jgi:type II secretory pathway pseudopilin PulG